MKKHIIIIFASLCILSSSFYACTQEGPKVENQENLELDNFEADLHAVFSLVSKDIPKRKTLKKQQLTALFLSSVLDVFPDPTAEKRFKESYLKAISGLEVKRQKSNSSHELAKLVQSFTDERHALEALNALISSDDGSVEQKQAFIILKETVAFFTQHSDIFSTYFSNTSKKSSYQKTGCTWWDSWGSCATGILGGAISGASAGCTAGEAAGSSAGPDASEVGCVIGGTIGAVAGGIVGAAENCIGCEN